MKNLIKIFIIALFFIGYVFNHTAYGADESSLSDISIDKHGQVFMNNAKVTQFMGNTILANLNWGSTILRVVIKTEKASVSKKYGETLMVNEIKVGDLINVKGDLESSPDVISIKASMIKDMSDERGARVFSGVVLDRATSTQGYRVSTTDNGIITVGVNQKTAIVKGTKNVGINDIKIGDKIENMEGVFNYSTKVLSADRIKAYLDMSKFLPKNFQGTLKNVSSTVLPTTLTVTIDGIDYTVKLSADCLVLNTKRYVTQLSRFVIGDTVRMYGAIPEGELPIINATVLRNISI